MFRKNIDLIRLTLDIKGRYHLPTGKVADPEPLGSPVEVRESVDQILRYRTYDVMQKVTCEQVPSGAVAYCSLCAGITGGNIQDPSLSDIVRYEIQFFSRV